MLPSFFVTSAIMTKEHKSLTPIGMQRSYGRTASRMSVADQAKLDARLEAYALKEEDLAWQGPMELEVGMGNGLAMLERAKNAPDRLFIGIEVYRNGLRSLVHRLEKDASIKNVRIVGEDVRPFLEGLPKNAFDRVCVLYPDPWPKKKHHKRRLVQQASLDLFDRVLKQDGELFFATDIPCYAQWIIREVYSHPVWDFEVVSPEDWAQEPAWWISTKYEQKAFREGRKPWYMTAYKIDPKGPSRYEKIQESIKTHRKTLEELAKK